MQNDRDHFEICLNSWVQNSCFKLGPNLRGILRFGSTTKSFLKPETDIDIIFVFNNLPKLRHERFALLSPAENELNSLLKKELPKYNLTLSPILRTPQDFDNFSPLYLDMVEHSVIHYDPDGLLQKTLIRTRDWIKKSGAYKVEQGTKWYWILDPTGKAEKIDW